ncbi:MAG TPA: NUDIX domain-containing protein [Candidatus Nanoarchaeia archaeon]|nr:NUDIX domain-containing protein [Candidatus Nanoarchaeia archaeon]
MIHSTSAGGVVVNKSGNILVVNQNNDSWSLPKGRIEEGETLRQTAEREIAEESGITKLKFIKELGTYQRYQIGRNGKDDLSIYKTIVIFLFTTAQDMLKPTDPHNPEARWVNKDDVSKPLTHRQDKEFFERVKDKLQ